MKSEKINKLLTALAEPAKHSRPVKQAETEAKKAPSADSDAVKFSSSFNKSEGIDLSPREQKMAGIKAQVEAGVYLDQVKSEDVATALMRDLGL